MKRVIVERLQLLMKYPYEIRARNSLFCHQPEFTVAAPVRLSPLPPKDAPQPGFRFSAI